MLERVKIELDGWYLNNPCKDEKQLPDAVSEDEQDNGEKIKMVHESMMIPVLVKAMQQQQELIDNLTARMQELESKIQ